MLTHKGTQSSSLLLMKILELRIAKVMTYVTNGKDNT